MGVDQLVTGGDVDNPVFQSVSTEDIATRAKTANVVIYQASNGEYHAAPTEDDGIIAASDDVAQLISDTLPSVPDHGTVEIRQPDDGSRVAWRQKITVSSPVTLAGSAQIEMSDGVNAYFIDWDPQMPVSDGPESNADGGIRNLTFWCNNDSNSGVGIINQLDSAGNDLIIDGVNIYNHTDTAIRARQSGTQLRNVQTLGGVGHRGAVFESGFNFVVASDLGGGFETKHSEPTLVYGGSIFNADESATGGVGAVLTGRDRLIGADVVDNDTAGVVVQTNFQTDAQPVIGLCRIHNNSLAADNTHDGLVLDGYDYGNGEGVRGAVIGPNQFWNRDPTKVGSGNGIQRYHIATKKDNVEANHFSEQVFRDGGGSGRFNITHTTGANYWRGYLGGGPFGGVDLSTVTGDYVGERAIANGSSTANAGDTARWNGTGWDVFQPATTI